MLIHSLTFSNLFWCLFLFLAFVEDWTLLGWGSPPPNMRLPEDSVDPTSETSLLILIVLLREATHADIFNQ